MNPISEQKPKGCALLAAGLLLVFHGLAAQPAPRMTILIKPGPMSEAIGKGELSVDIDIPQMNVPAGAPLLSLSTMLPGLSKPQTVEGLTAKDAAGPIPLEPRMHDGTLQWTSTRAVKGELLVHYREPIENTPMTQGGPP